METTACEDRRSSTRIDITLRLSGLRIIFNAKIANKVYHTIDNLETGIREVRHCGLDGITFLIGKLTIACLCVSDENKGITELSKLTESSLELIL